MAGKCAAKINYGLMNNDGDDDDDDDNDDNSNGKFKVNGWQRIANDHARNDTDKIHGQWHSQPQKSH